MEYSGTQVNWRRRPSKMAMGRMTSHSMPVSSPTSFWATSAAE